MDLVDVGDHLVQVVLGEIEDQLSGHDWLLLLRLRCGRLFVGGSLRLDQVSLGLAGLAIGGTPAVVGFLGFATRLCHDLALRWGVLILKIPRIP